MKDSVFPAFPNRLFHIGSIPLGHPDYGSHRRRDGARFCHASTVPGVSVGGHFGGAIVGSLVGSLSLAPRSWKVPTWASVVVPVAVSIACVAVAVAFVTG